MVQQSFVFFFLILSLSVWGQDERYYRQILSGELPKLNDSRSLVQNQFTVSGSVYRIDLNNDGIEESLVPEKSDGVDSLSILDSSGRVINWTKFLTSGRASSIYKIRLVQISTTVKALLIFLDEGVTAGKKMESVARFYVLTFENNDLSRLNLAQGPHIFHEKEAQRDQYFRRDYQVNAYDIDGDGTREIAVQFNHIQRIMKYENGVWKRF